MSNELLITVIWTERNCADAPIAKMKKTWIKLFMESNTLSIRPIICTGMLF